MYTLLMLSLLHRGREFLQGLVTPSMSAIGGFTSQGTPSRYDPRCPHFSKSLSQVYSSGLFFCHIRFSLSLRVRPPNLLPASLRSVVSCRFLVFRQPRPTDIPTTTLSTSRLRILVQTVHFPDSGLGNSFPGFDTGCPVYVGRWTKTHREFNLQKMCTSKRWVNYYPL